MFFLQPNSVPVGDELLYHCVSGVLEDSDGGNGKGKLAVKCNSDGDFEIDDQGQNKGMGDAQATSAAFRMFLFPLIIKVSKR